MSERIYLSSPDVTQSEEDAVVRAIRSGWIAPLGPEVDAFEAELASYCGREHAVALSSGRGRGADLVDDVRRHRERDRLHRR